MFRFVYSADFLGRVCLVHNLLHLLKNCKKLPDCKSGSEKYNPIVAHHLLWLRIIQIRKTKYMLQKGIKGHCTLAYFISDEREAHLSKCTVIVSNNFPENLLTDIILCCWVCLFWTFIHFIYSWITVDVNDDLGITGRNGRKCMTAILKSLFSSVVLERSRA